MLPSVTVDYRNLRIDTEALVGSASIPTVANVPLTFLRVRAGVVPACVCACVVRGQLGAGWDRVETGLGRSWKRHLPRHGV